MLAERKQIHTISIVALGEFNPSIIQPYWLAYKKLIGEQEASDAKIDLIHQEVVNFSLSWVSFHIQKNRFEMKTSNEPYESLQELFLGIFNILSETPIKRIGINHIMHFQVRDADEMYNIGNILVPLNNWDFFDEPRVQHIEIINHIRPDGLKGNIRVKIEPSDLITGNQFGISINFNDDYIIDQNNPRAIDAVKLVKNQWSESFRFVDIIINGLNEKLFI